MTYALPSTGHEIKAVLFDTFGSVVDWRLRTGIWRGCCGWLPARSCSQPPIIVISPLLGYPFNNPPAHVPLDEDMPPTPEVVYALSKDLEEEMARQYCRWNPDQKMIGLRFSNVMDSTEYAEFPSFEDDPASRKWNLWPYIDPP